MKTGLNEEFQIIKNDLKNFNIKKQIANILTFTRLFSPFVLIPLMYYEKKSFFILMVILFSLTDTFDGYFARKYNNVSKFGAYLDAVVDKVFALSLLIPIVIKTTLNNQNYHLIFINIFLELVIGCLNIYSFFKNLNPHSTIFGKIKTIFLFVLLGILYLDKFILLNNLFLFIVILITLILQVITIVSYYMQIKRRKKFS